MVQSLHGGPETSGDEKLVRLLFFVGALKDAAAARVTVVAPYMAFLRKDQQTKPRDPVTTRYLAQLFEAVGLNSATVDKYFTGTASRVEGIGVFEIAEETIRMHKAAFGDDPVLATMLDTGG